jgi:hypothetical protein
MLKIGGKYVHLGTAWSTDQVRRGSYNLYYCVADRITGPYGPRKFAGRFLGHGTPFQTRDGKWWCTAFFNANVPPLPREGIETRDLSEDAQTINEQGVTIVPLDVRVLDDGDIFLRAKDPAYATPGPDEVQEFVVSLGCLQRTWPQLPITTDGVAGLRASDRSRSSRAEFRRPESPETRRRTEEVVRTGRVIKHASALSCQHVASVLESLEVGAAFVERLHVDDVRPCDPIGPRRAAYLARVEGGHGAVRRQRN